MRIGNSWLTDYLFYWSRRDWLIPKSEVKKAFNDDIRRIGIPEEKHRRRKLTFHAWRHWFVSYLRGSVQDHVLRQLTQYKTEMILNR